MTREPVVSLQFQTLKEAAMFGLALVVALIGGVSDPAAQPEHFVVHLGSDGIVAEERVSALTGRAVGKASGQDCDIFSRDDLLRPVDFLGFRKVVASQVDRDSLIGNSPWENGHAGLVVIPAHALGSLRDKPVIVGATSPILGYRNKSFDVEAEVLRFLLSRIGETDLDFDGLGLRDIPVDSRLGGHYSRPSVEGLVFSGQLGQALGRIGLGNGSLDQSNSLLGGSLEFGKLPSGDSAIRNARQSDYYGAGGSYRVCCKNKTRNTIQFAVEMTLAFGCGTICYAVFGVFGGKIHRRIPVPWRIAICIVFLILGFILAAHGSSVWVECEERRICQAAPDGKAPQQPTSAFSSDRSAPFPERAA